MFGCNYRIEQTDDGKIYAKGVCCLSGVPYQTQPFSKEAYNTWHDGAMIQNALGELSDNDREFLMSGIAPEALYVMFSEDE